MQSLMLTVRRGHHLLLLALPVVAAVVGLKALMEWADWHPLDLNPLLSGLIASMVFMLGFLLSGTITDYKESERLPGELACSLETMADECLILRHEHPDPTAHAVLAHVERLGLALLDWLRRDTGLEEVLGLIRSLNPHFSAMNANVQPGYITRLKGEQAGMRRTVVRIDAIRNTSFIPAGYVIVEIVGALLLVAMLLTQESTSTWESLFFVGTITLLLTYIFLLIRDLDDPFGETGSLLRAADVSLLPLERAVVRLAEEREEVEELDLALDAEADRRVVEG